MKKYIQIFVILVMVLAAIGLASNGSAWANTLPASWNSSGGAKPISGILPGSSLNAPLPTRIIIDQNGVYKVGGVCVFEIEFKDPETKKLKVEVDAEIPIEESSKVPFSGEGNLFYPGCHLVHFKQDKIVTPLSSQDGKAKVCFGANPDMKMTIYYYLDSPASGKKAWIQLPTSLEDNQTLACANAPYTGVYMPAGKLVDLPDSDELGSLPNFAGGPGGSVVPPPADITVTESGTYAVGGICMVKAVYKIGGLSDDISVAYPEEDTLTVPFPENDDLLYFPGCHVLHYRDNQVKDTMTSAEGEWEICFAARPSKDMTIYYYHDNLEEVKPPWKPLETTTRNGLSCAKLVDHSAVYTPAGK